MKVIKVVYIHSKNKNMPLPMSYNRLANISQGEFSREVVYEAKMTIGGMRSGRAVMMSHKEEGGFARYLIMKRSTI